MAPLARGLRAEEYTVAWISAIQKEFLIACALLDEEHDSPVDIGNDDNCYTFGRMGEHNVVLASLPMARIGITQAGMLATEMLRSFPKLRFGLMVGIAGGAPTAKNDIRLGDVIVSIPDDRRRLGGVVNYAFGVSDQQLGFQRRGNLNAPPEVLLNAANKLKTKYDRRGCRLDSLIGQVIDQNTPRLEKYRRPTVEDTLYLSTYIHPQNAASCIEVCKQQDQSFVKRPARSLNPEQPYIHYGIVGSADNLMKNATLRDELASADGILCFEMEAAGLMNSDLRCMVIRGICDYSDTHKNDDWQEYAAAAAAAYAKELMGAVRAIKSRSTGLSDVVHLLTGAKQGEFRDPREELVSHFLGVMDSLKYESMNDKQEFSRPEAIYDVDWIWQTNFPKWLSKDDHPFWVTGKAGSGKSTLMAYLASSRKTLEKLRSKDPTFTIVHFHFDYRAGTGLPNNMLGMYRTILYQLADHDETIKARLTTLLDSGRLRVNSDTNLLDAIVEGLTMSGTKLCMFLDGLDEFVGDIMEIVHVCRLMMERMPIKFCLAGRPDNRIAESLNIRSQITMQDFNEASMRRYLERVLSLKAPYVPGLVKRFSPNLTRYLVRRAEGILLWFKLVVDLVVEQFEAGCTNNDIIDLVQAVPDGLDAVYDRMLNMIPEAFRPEAAFILFLAGQLRSMSKWTEKGVAAEMNFVTTDVDHFWGAYDFILEELGSELRIERVADHEELQKRTRQLLRGLVEFAPATAYAQMLDLMGETGLTVRYVHETFSAFVDRSGWVDTYLPEKIKAHYSHSFWLGFCANMISRAAKDQMIVPKNLDIAREEMSMWFDELEGEDFNIGNIYLDVTRKVVHHVFRPYSMIMALHNEFCPLVASVSADPRLRADPKLWVDPILLVRGLETFAKHLITKSAPDVSFPESWKQRHVTIRTALFLLIDLAAIHEASGESSYPIIAKAMQCHLNPILSYAILMSGRDSPDRRLLALLQRDPKLLPILDAYVAIKGDLPYYFRDRLAKLTPTAYQLDFLFKAILSYPSPRQIPSVKAVQGVLGSLADCGRFPKQRDLCFLLKKTKCWQTASDLALALTSHVAPEEVPVNGLPRCCDAFKGGVRPLFHWAEVVCWKGCRCSQASTSSATDYGMVLQLLLLHGADLHENCYPGGTVFEALLDHNLEPRDDNVILDRKAKFLALVEYGFDPALLVSKGKDALQIAVHAYSSGSAKSNLYEIDSIVGYLRYYEIYGSWPGDEIETLDLCESAIQRIIEPTHQQESSAEVPPATSDSASTDNAGNSSTSEATVRRRPTGLQTDSVGDEISSTTAAPSAVEDRPIYNEARENVSKLLNSFEDVLKVTTTDASQTMNQWKMSFSGRFKKLTE